MDLMYARGVAGTSLVDVMEASGTGKSQVYRYFAGKEEFVQCVVTEQVTRVLAFQASLFERVQSLRGLEEWRDAVVAACRSRRGALGCPVGSLVDGGTVGPGPAGTCRSLCRLGVAYGGRSFADA